MNLRRLVATSALVIASMGLYAGTAYAEPVTAPPASDPVTPTVTWESRVEAGGVVTTVDAGIFKVSDDGKQLQLLDPADKLVLSVPLSINLNGISFPFDTEFTDEGRTVKLVPNMTQPSITEAALPLQNAASPQENLSAQQNFTSQIGLASAIGGLVGTIIGAGAGCVVTLAAGCLPGLVTGAGIGGVVGTIAVGGPTLLVAGIDFVNTLNAAPGTTQWAE